MEHIIEFNDYRAKYENLESQDWITIYNSEKKTFNGYYDDIFEYSALVEDDEEYIAKYLESDNWEFGIDSFGKSYFGKVFNRDSSKIYFKDGLSEDRFEYLVACRHFNEKYEASIEINPKLIWYYNLVKVEDNYIDPITDEVKIKIDKNKIVVLKTYLKDFLSAHNKKCIICFDNRRFYKTQSKLEYYSIDSIGENMNFTVDISSYKYNNYNGFSRIMGKVIMNPYKTPKHRDYKEYVEEKQYEEFIIKEDDSTGEEIMFTCDESKLANYFGSNPNSPHFLTPIFFNRKVLDKYTNDPKNYTVGDGSLFYLNEWAIPFTINEDNKVTVWLGDLGKLPFKEQKYWKLYNELPQGGVESKFFKRQLEAKFTDAITPEKRLFQLINELNQTFLDKYGDKIINELSSADIQIKSAFTIPTNTSTTLYQTFLIQICKIIVESINTKLISKFIEAEKLKDENGNKYASIKQLYIFLNENGYKNAEKLNDVLKLIYSSRSVLAGHTGSISRYNKLWGREKNYNPNFISDAKVLILTLNTCLNDIIGE